MPRMFHVPRSIRTPAQRAALGVLWNDLNNVNMVHGQDLMAHIIRVNEIVQHIIFADCTFRSTPDQLRIILRGTLLMHDRQLLDDVWATLPRGSTYRQLVRRFLRTHRRRVLTMLMRQCRLPNDIIHRIVERALEGYFRWDILDNTLPRRVHVYNARRQTYC